MAQPAARPDPMEDLRTAHAAITKAEIKRARRAARNASNARGFR